MKESSLTFISKSILPIGNSDEINNATTVRVITTFGLRIEPINTTTCRILGVNYLYNVVPLRYMQNYINKKVAFQGIFSRLRKYFDEHEE
jgi:hypothetical protein